MLECHLPVLVTNLARKFSVRPWLIRHFDLITFTCLAKHTTTRTGGQVQTGMQAVN